VFLNPGTHAASRSDTDRRLRTIACPVISAASSLVKNRNCACSVLRFAAGDEPHFVDDREASGKEGYRASSMREDVLHVRRTRESVRAMHLSDSAIGVCREVQQIVGHRSHDGPPGPDVGVVPWRETGDDAEWTPPGGSSGTRSHCFPEPRLWADTLSLRLAGASLQPDLART
jgi:hypothetical protein